MRPKGCKLPDNRDDFRKKILSVFLFFLAFGIIAYALVFFTGKSSVAPVAETVKPRENRDAMTDPASGTALTYSLGTDGGVSVHEGSANEAAGEATSEEPAEAKQAEVVKEQPTKQTEPKAEAAKQVAKKPDTPKPAPKPEPVKAKPAEAPKVQPKPAAKPAQDKAPSPTPA